MKEKMIQGMKHLYSEEQQKWLPEIMEENNLTYKLDKATMTYFPMLQTDEEEDYNLTSWGRKRLSYIKENKPGYYQRLMIQGLWEHLVSVDKQANEMENNLMKEMSKAEGITEELKAKDQMSWVAQRNNLKQRVREIVTNEVIYQ
ncbi:MAG: TnpV protein [Firmicutes bacterium]|nr:TnpV protein [Bacillota bacterium]